MKGQKSLKCNSGQLVDEFHFCMECRANIFLPANICKRPNVINLGHILNMENKITLKANLLNVNIH